MGDVFSVVLALIGMVGVLVLTYYGSRWYAKRVANASGNISGGNHIKLVERVVVSKTSSLVIVDIEGEQMLLGISDQNIQLIKKLDHPVSLPEKKDLNKDSFAKILKSIKNKDS